jgi:hypothetical protein
MTEDEILLALKNSQFWNAAYNNYDVTSRAAKDELTEWGWFEVDDDGDKVCPRCARLLEQQEEELCYI